MFYCMFYFTCDRSLSLGYHSSPMHTADADDAEATQLTS